MPSLDNFKTVTEETGGNRNMVPTKNATNLMDCKEIKIKSVLQEADTTRSLINRTYKCQTTFLAM